jgi:hypothetical protein
MTMNQQNPQRGTGVRKPGTAVRPNPAAAPAPAPAGANRAPAPRRPGAPAAAGARPPLRAASAPPRGGGGKANKILVIVILLLLGGMIAYGFIPRKDKDGNPKPGLFMALANKYGLFKGGAAKGEGADPALPDLDRRYKRAIDSRDRAKAFLDEQQKFGDAPDKLTELERKRVVDELEKLRSEVESGTDDLARVAAAAGKETKIDAATAKEDQKKQKAFAMELGKAIVKWKGPIGEIFAKAGAPEFVANKFNEKKPEERKEEKKDPKRGETVVAPANPNDIPKPPTEPEKPKEEPKPEPKPEPEKPKPEPKPEPEKPKPAEPKPEPEKPKAEPKPDAEKPKPEPEKPKEEPKTEPKPEPEKPKPAEPKPEPEKPKEEPKAEPKPEPKPEKKAEVLVAEADQLVSEGKPVAIEVLGASKNLPEDPEKLKTLWMKLETAQAYFVKARDTFASVKQTAPASADVPTKIAKIEKILEALQKAADGLKSKMK